VITSRAQKLSESRKMVKISIAFARTRWPYGPFLSNHSVGSLLLRVRDYHAVSLFLYHPPIHMSCPMLGLNWILHEIALSFNEQKGLTLCKPRSYDSRHAQTEITFLGLSGPPVCGSPDFANKSQLFLSTAGLQYSAVILGIVTVYTRSNVTCCHGDLLLHLQLVFSTEF
jgi:hypothetical protein